MHVIKIRIFWGNRNDANYKTMVENMLPKVPVAIQEPISQQLIQFLDEDLGDISEEQSEMFH